MARPYAAWIGRAVRSGLRPSAGIRRPALYLCAAVAAAVVVNLVAGGDPATGADARTSQPTSVAQRLGLTAQVGAAQRPADLGSLEQRAASRSSRAAAQTAAQQAQAAADQVVLDQKKAAEEAARQAEAAKQAAAAQQATTGQPTAAAAPAPAAGAVAHITNSAGPVLPGVQAAANLVVSNVPGAGALTIGGTRPTADDHGAGKALDWMVLGNVALGQAIVQYHIAHWNELGVTYLIYQQRILMSPGGAWQAMEDRGSPTANHMDHVHVTYRG
jgi:hypothetical protein